ncbi:hypothetical protein B0F90DRAFT_1636021 [Multifurca ochricompacta]|uniref:FCP1 homology domain-containing protein n=1 Tax=Multifurca ochricompacta TaxID=376703 RepID=A0AAD4LZR8_9AGAM|nr:hypothetical protein B0F90DRAFT_1636021 [Multifurca ochricompacta]
MVWSSAQPHSVDDMVHHAFGNDRDRLVAIWARDTLGLAEDLYHRKVLTIKDLEKPWAALARWSGHSAATTILLDDSHAKAARQPYNHLCVSEYTRKQRQADLAALQLQQLVHDAISQPEETHHHPTGELDNTLLAVIGILHAVRLQSSIAGWLCAGALLSSSSSSSSSSQREGDSDVAWFEDPVLVSLWAKRGREAMHSLGLQVDHGVEP